MMITPIFEVTQDDEFVNFTLKCPYIKAQEVEFCIEKTEFKFYAKPYFLKLNLSHDLIEDGREKATYDVNKGEMMVVLPKAVKGQTFDDLNLLSKMSVPSSTSPRIDKPMIQVMTTANEQPLSTIELGELRDRVALAEANDEEFDWSLSSTSCDPCPTALFVGVGGGSRYGFNQQYENIFKHVSAYELPEFVDISSPETTSAEQRKQERIEKESNDFNEEHYAADFAEPDFLLEMQTFMPWWQTVSSTQDPFSWTTKEKEILTALSTKDYFIDHPKTIYLGLIDLLFAYCYNHRTTLGENTVESRWTIRKLSATLSYFETYQNITDAIFCSFRRSLCYPLYRNADLSTLILHDVCKVLSLGKRSILRALLEMHDIFSKDDAGQYLNRLYLDDYIIWLQKASNRAIESMAAEMQQILARESLKNWVGFDLERIEAMTKGCDMNEADEADEDENSSTTEEEELESQTDCNDSGMTVRSVKYFSG